MSVKASAPRGAPRIAHRVATIGVWDTRTMRWTDLLIRVPPFHKAPSGLYVPTSISRPAVSGVEPDLPPGVEVREPDLFIMAKPPSSLEQMRVIMDESVLGLPVSTPGQVEHLVSSLSFETGMVALSRLSAQIAHLRADVRAQAKLADEVFGDPRLVKRIQRRSRLGNEPLEIFGEQHITAFQRLLVLHGRDVPLGRHDPNEQRVFDRALIAVSCLTAEDNLGDAETHDGRASWLAYLIQNGTYNRTDSALEEMTRPQIIFGDIAAAPDLRSHADFCPMDEWLVEDCSFSIGEQYALGFAVLARTKALDETARLHERSLLHPQFLPDLAERLNRDPALAAKLLSAERTWYRERFGDGEQTTVRAAWERTAFDMRPLLRLGDGHLLLISPRAIENWLGDGFYHRSLASARGRNQENRFQRFYGVLVERYVRQLFQHVHPEPRPLGAGRVFGDWEYGRPGKRRRTPDVCIDCGPDLVLIEATSGRFTLDTLLHGSPKAALEDLHRLLFDKIDQLGKRIRDFLDGAWSVPDGQPGAVERIWPVIVTADMLQNHLLWDEINESLPATLQDARVKSLTLLDLSDVEQLTGLVERGYGLADLLKRKSSGSYRHLDLRRFVSETSDLPHDARLSMIENRWAKEIANAMTLLGYEADQDRIHQHDRGQ